MSARNNEPNEIDALRVAGALFPAAAPQLPLSLLDQAMNDRCHFCRRELEPAEHFVDVGQPARPMVTHAALADTSLGRIGVCNICYNQERFDGLTSEDIATLHYMFGDPYSEPLRRLQLLPVIHNLTSCLLDSFSFFWSRSAERGSQFRWLGMRVCERQPALRFSPRSSQCS